MTLDGVDTVNILAAEAVRGCAVTVQRAQALAFTPSQPLRAFPTPRIWPLLGFLGAIDDVNQRRQEPGCPKSSSRALIEMFYCPHNMGLLPQLLWHARITSRSSSAYLRVAATPGERSAPAAGQLSSEEQEDGAAAEGLRPMRSGWGDRDHEAAAEEDPLCQKCRGYRPCVLRVPAGVTGPLCTPERGWLLAQAVSMKH